MSKIKKEVLNTVFLKARKALKDGNLDLARDSADLGIAYVATKRQDGMEPTDLIDGVKIETWLMRFWVFLENNNLMLG